MKKWRSWLNWLLSKRRITRDRSLENWMQKMLYETDKLCLIELEPGTPTYNLQQSLMKNAARYRVSQYKEKNNESEKTA